MIKNGCGFIKVRGYTYNDPIFEGNYLNGERTGKGKEYFYNTQLKFEGEYLYGEKTGKGKQYSPNGRLKFEGEYLNDRKIKGKEFLKTEFFLIKTKRIYYEGEYLYGIKWNGKGYDEEGNVIYEINKGKGINIEFDKYGNLYEGEYSYGKKNGKGKEYFYINNQDRFRVFEGIYVNDKPRDGIYKEYAYNKLVYEEEFKKGKFCGKVKEYNYINGGLIYEGEFLHGEIEGGEYSDGKRNRKGKEYNSFNGALKYEGEYLNGERNGKGKEYKQGKLIFEGDYLNGKRNGKWKEYDSEGKIIFEGEYENNKRKIK